MITLDDALTRGRGIERPFNCPDPDHQDRNASASVNVVKGFWVCFACGAKGTLEGHVPDPKDALRALTESEKPQRIFAEAWLDLFDIDHPSEYWATRFGEQIARRYRCGTDPMLGYPTYPLRDRSGNVLGVVHRTEDKQKYHYPYGPKVSTTLFMSWSTRKPEVVVLVEGGADVMALDQGGLPSSWLVVGTYGAGLHFPQVQIVADFTPKVIIAAFDGDDAGRGATDRAVTQCVNVAPVLSHPWDTFGVNDPGDLPPEQRIPALLTTLEKNGYARYGGSQ